MSANPAVTAMFKKIADSNANAGGNYISKDGDYLFRVKKLLLERKFTGTCFIAELEIVESKVQVPGIDPHPVGARVSFVQNLDKQLSAAGNVKAFVLALYDESESSVTGEEIATAIEESVSDAQPAAGKLIRCSTFHKPSKAGKDLLLLRWESVPETKTKA